MKYTARYKNIFMYGSLQSVGHTEEYFAAHTEKLVVYIIMPRVKNRGNLIHVYLKGKLVKDERVWSASNFILYYVSWLFHYWKFILTYFGRNEHFLVFSGHPISFFGMSIQKLLRPRIAYAFWIGDYYPPVHWSLVAYERVKKYYHDRIAVTYYLSDPINRIMNGRVVRQANKRTVMWGVKVKSQKKNAVQEFRLLFVGVVRPSQGLEDIFSFLAQHKNVRLRIVGVCEQGLFETYTKLIRELRIERQVDFPNTFLDDEELITLASQYHVGVAIYDKTWRSSTYYTDPGKVKTYVDLGLPVIMTNISAIAPFIKKYRAGVVIDQVRELPKAVEEIKNHYDTYQKGLRVFYRHFEYETYYKQAFVVLQRG